jgi:acetolactate synthase-1/2/3 large subunit
VIIADRVGRRPESVDVLVRIAELLGAPVLEGRDSVNFPSDHVLYGGPKASPLLRRADVVLLLASEVPWVPAIMAPAPEATVLQIDVDCVKASMPSWSYPVDLSLTADPGTALPLLLAELEELATADRRQTWSEQRQESEREVAELHADWQRKALSTDPADAVDAMLAALNRAIPSGAITVEEAVTNQGPCLRQLRRPPGRHFGVGAPALGSALGAAMGARLADPEAPVFAITGDGAFNFGVPTAALWSAHRAGAPFVTVILDNGTYLASRMPVERLFPEGAARRQNDFPETRLGPPIDYAALARSCGGEGIVVEEPSEMGDAVERAIAALGEGRCTVIDARLPAPP